MFINSPIIGTAFRLINFFALISLGFFLFRKYALPNFLLKIAQKKAFWEALFSQQSILEKEQVALNEQLKQDALLCENFKAKIDEWKAVIHQEQTAYSQDRNRINALVLENNSKRSYFKQEQQKKNAVVQQVVDQLENSLTTHFQNAKNRSDYLQELLFAIQKRTE